MKLTSEYTTLLISTFSSGSNEQRKKSQAELRSQFKNQLFVETMMEILTICPSQSVQLAATNILKEYSNNLIMTHNQQKLARYCNSITELFKQPAISLKIFRMLSDNLKFVFTRDPIHNIRLEAIKRLVREFSQVEENNYNYAKADYMYLILLTRALISFPMYDILNYQLFKGSFYVLAKANTRMYSFLEGQPKQDIVDICQLLSELMPFYFRRSDIKHHQIVQELLWSEEIDNLFKTILTSTLRMLNGICVQNPMPWQASLMKIQANTLQLTQIILRHRLVDEERDKLNIQLLNITPLIIRSIQGAIAFTLDTLIETEPSIATLTKAIRLFETLVRYPSHCSFFKSNILQSNVSILHTVIFPLLQIPTTLKQSFVQKPQLFIGFFNYMFDSSLVNDDDITDELLALQTSVSQFVIMAIEFMDILSNIVEFSLRVLNESSNFDQRSICLILLGIVSYSVNNKSDILRRIKQFLESTLQFHAQSSTDINQQILQVLGMMIISRFLYPACDQSFSSKVLHIALNTLNHNNSQPHRILALELLLGAIKSKSSPKSQIEQLIGYLMSLTDRPSEGIRVLDVLYELFNERKSLLEDTDLSLKVVKCFVQKIKNGQGQSSFIRTANKKCWNIIKQIMNSSDSSSFSRQQFIKLIEKEASSLYFYLTSQQKSMREDIINFNIQLLSKTGRVSQYQQKIVECLPHLLSIQDHNIEFIYEFLMLFIRYGSVYIQNSDQTQKILFEECIRCSMTLMSNTKESAAIKGIILLEILLLYCSNLDSSAWSKAIWNAFELSNISHIYYTFTKSNLVSFLALSLVTFPDFSDQQYVNKLISKILAESYCIDVDFSSKIYVISLCKLIKGEAKSPIVKCYQLPKMVECVTDVLTISLKKTNSPDMDQEESEYFENVKLIFSNIPKIDEVQLFKKLMLDFKRTKEHEFRGIVSSLKEDVREKLSSLLTSQFVHEEVRQIVSVRRNNISS